MNQLRQRRVPHITAISLLALLCAGAADAAPVARAPQTSDYNALHWRGIGPASMRD